METKTKSHLLLHVMFELLLMSVFIHDVWAQQRGNLNVYQTASFDNPIQKSEIVITRLDHFTVHPDTGEVYVGAVNFLYKLNNDLKQVINVSTCSASTCLNYNKILVLHNGMLVTCGSEFPSSDQCQMRRQDDLGDGGSRRRIAVASYGTRTTASIIAPRGTPSTPRLYVANSYSPETDHRDIDPIARRLLITGNGFMFADSDNLVTFTSEYLNNYDPVPFPINYVSVFNWDGFTYFATYQRKKILSTSPHVSKLGRLCHNSNNVDSYTEILIECNGPSGLFSLMQAAHVGPAGPHLAQSLALDESDQVLYAVFAKNRAGEGGTDGRNPIPAMDCALCVYKMSDIQNAFRAAVRGCIQSGSTYTINILQGSVCGTQTGLNPDPYICNTDNNYQYATGISQNTGTSVVHLPGHLASSIITSTELNHTVAFIGTTEGQLLKVHIENNTFARFYESVTLDGTPVMKDTMLSDTKELVYVLTEQKLIKMRVENCGGYSTCETCIGTDAGNDADPYCGWCTLERRCTRYADCLLPDVSTRWLAYNAQCIAITHISPAETITFTNQQITLTVQQLPDPLDGQQYVCRFGEHFNSTATDYSGERFDCMTPPAGSIPAIPSGDHVTISLSVLSTETGVDIVREDITFYDCDTHKTCVSCVGSDWACNWCVLDNRCIPNALCATQNDFLITGLNSQGTSMEGPDACPQLQQQNNQVLIPNNVNRQIAVDVSNFPSHALISRYQCSLDIEGMDQFVDASRDGSTVTCNLNSISYLATQQEMNVTLSLWWTDTNSNMHRADDRHGFKVTLYKCEVLRPDCSRCVSNETTRAELGCMWCGDTCGVADSTACMAASEKVAQDNTLNCPDPIIYEVYPLFGPDEGNTIITVKGSNLGREFSNLRGVNVGGQVCDLQGLERYYQTGASVYCKTRPSYDTRPQRLRLSVTGANGAVQPSHGYVTFQYKDPVVTEFNPKIGPQSGGTQVTISGESFDTGRHIYASIGSAPCLFERSVVKNSGIICQTSGVSQLGSWPLYVFFDGAVRISQEQFTYTLDPTVVGIEPSTTIISGGRKIQVRGSGFSIFQRPQIVVTLQSNQQEFIEDCSKESDEVMYCISPSIDLPSHLSGVFLNTTLGFIFDGVTTLRNWCLDPNACTVLEYYQDPMYFSFDDPVYGYEDGIARKDGDSLLLRGAFLDLAITAPEITVYIGREVCTDVTLDRHAIVCKLPQTQPEAGDHLGQKTDQNLPFVRVFHGTNLAFDIGYIRYPSTPITVIVCVVIVVVLAIFVIVAVVMYREAKLAKREVEERRTDLIMKKIEVTENVMAASGVFGGKSETSD